MVDFKEIKDVEKLILKENDVLLKKVRDNNVTASGLYVPDSARIEVPPIYGVIAVGKAVDDLVKGDLVIGISLERVPLIMCREIEYYLVQRHQIVFAVSKDNYNEQFK